ncbi:MAG TPA: hypothetical protein VJV78_48475 [Polyangiales bacterium]|nr:hypothetical protein [Polyangiales bacterium]
MFIERAQRGVERVADEEVDAGLTEVRDAEVRREQGRAQPADDRDERIARRPLEELGFIAPKEP